MATGQTLNPESVVWQDPSVTCGQVVHTRAAVHRLHGSKVAVKMWNTFVYSLEILLFLDSGIKQLMSLPV